MKIIGHRGAKGLAPEHTVESFNKALSYHVPEIEFDIRVTKDGIPVLEHDNTIEAPDGKNYEVSAYTLDELLGFKPDLMTLEQTITLINKRAVQQIELKPNEDYQCVLDTIYTFIAKGWTYHDFIITSRDYTALKAIRASDPKLPLSIIHDWSGTIAVYRAKRLGTRRIGMNEHVMWSLFIRGMARRGWQVSGFSMNDPVRARKWTALGLYAVITDYPDRFADDM